VKGREKRQKAQAKQPNLSRLIIALEGTAVKARLSAAWSREPPAALRGCIFAAGESQWPLTVGPLSREADHDYGDVGLAC